MHSQLNFDKLIWDEKDFEEMGWHDCKIYGLAFKNETFELVFDLDYIVNWVKPENQESYFKFWVVPATLVFKNVWDLNVELEDTLDMEIEDLYRNESDTVRKEYFWKLVTRTGQITFKSTGYKQYFRESPRLIESQKIGFTERGGISFTENT